MDEPGPSPLIIEVVRDANIWNDLPISDTMISRATNAAFAASLPIDSLSYEITIMLSDDASVRELNRRWRGKDKPTNVLSFPAGESVGVGEGEPVPLGDIVLAAETVRGEAEQQGVALADHVSHLVVHGVLHLLGHDHEDDHDAARMETLETSILASLGIADPYAEANAFAEQSG